MAEEDTALAFSSSNRQLAIEKTVDAGVEMLSNPCNVSNVKILIERRRRKSGSHLITDGKGCAISGAGSRSVLIELTLTSILRTDR